MDDTLIEVEDRTYVNPQKGLDERMAFIDTLRDIQAQNTAQINQNTYNLGRPVTSNVGGLGGSEGLWKAQYQTPQLNAQIADLKTIANEYAKKQIMQNLNDIVQNRYKQTVRNYARRAKNRSGSGGGTTTEYPLANTTTYTPDPEIVTESTSGKGVGTVTARPGEHTIASPYMGDDGNPINYVFNDDNVIVRLDGVVDRGSATYNALKKQFPNLVD